MNVNPVVKDACLLLIAILLVTLMHACKN
jgi:hypothetical protein